MFIVWQKRKESVTSWPGFEEEEDVTKPDYPSRDPYDHAQWYFKDFIIIYLP